MARSLERIAPAIAFLLGLATILGALGSQYIGGLQPCELCLQQRMPYYWGLPLLALILLLWERLPKPVKLIAMGIVAALFAYGAYLGAFHAGVEWGFWPGPTTCSGLGDSFSLDALNDLKPVIGCDVVQFRYLGISMAGYNAIISLAISALLVFSIVKSARQR